MFPATSMPDRDWWQTLWPNPLETMKSLGVKPDMTIVDICCGDGYFTIPLAKIAKKVYGLELDANLLDIAAQYSVESGATNCEWIIGDAMNATNLIPEKMDFVLMANTFHGIPNKTEMIGDIITKLLKPNGKFAVINWHSIPREETVVMGFPRGPKTEMRVSPDDLSQMICLFEFVLESTVEVSPYHYVCVFVKK